MAKKFVLFDCDGVLVDSEYLASHVMAEMLHSYQCPITAEEIMTEYVGRKDVEIVRILIEKYSLSLPHDFMEQYAVRLDAVLATQLKPILGISAVLETLALPRAIVSNSTLPRIKASLKSAALEAYFSEENLFSPDIATYSKPDPRIYQFAIDKLKWNKSDVVVIEDSPTGVAAASGAGLEVIGFLGATHSSKNQEEKLLRNGAKHIAKNSEELSRLLKEICN